MLRHQHSPNPGARPTAPAPVPPRRAAPARALGALLAVLALLAARSLQADSTVVFNEIFYHPPEREAELEWIELHNQMSADMDISGWQLLGGVDTIFPEGTVVPGGGFVVVAADPAALEAAGIAAALGPFTGRLDNAGERLELRNNSFRLMDTVRYRDGGRWPVAPDGSGHSLAKRRSQTASDDPESWTTSAELGGTPGEHNFPREEAPGRFPEALAAYWSFDEESGLALDPAGGNNGRLGRAATRVEGLVGRGAVAFDNTVQAFVNVGRGAQRDFSAPEGLTIEALVVSTWSAELSDEDMIFRKEDGEDRIVFGFQHDAELENRDVPIEPVFQPVLAFGIHAGDRYSELDMPLDGREGRPALADLQDGAPHALAAVYSSGTGRKAIYVDGREVFAAGLPPGGAVTSGGGTSAYLGNMSGRTAPFSGILDEVTFWKRALAPEEIAARVARALAGEDMFQAPEEETAPGPAIGFSETSVPAGGEAWVELAAAGGKPVSLEGLVLAGPAGSGGESVLRGGTLPAGGFLVLHESDLGFPLRPGEKLFLFDRDRSRVLAAVLLEEGARVRPPQGSGPWLVPARATPGEANAVELHDEIVIHEIHYHPFPLREPDGTGFRDPPEAWVELTNRSDRTMSLEGWRLDGGIEYAFGAGTSLDPGEFIVVAADRDYLSALHPGAPIAGNFSGRLSWRSDRIVVRDARGNPADEVRYFDRHPWPRYADGGGSTLELRDPWADNSRPEAWAASEETARSRWQTYSYEGVARPNVGPAQWREFVFGLLDAGEALVDDFSVVEDPAGEAVELLQDGGFDRGLATWRALGTHGFSDVVPDPADPANPVLHLVATGPTEHMHNHLETTLAASARVRLGRAYRISFRARWLGGSNQLHTRLYFNVLPRTTYLEVPGANGTPGAPNSTGTENLGPTYSGLRHEPPVPAPGEDVAVSVRASDPDAVESLRLWWRAGGSEWESAPMELRGEEYEGVIPGRASGEVVQFYVEGRDRAGAVSTAPPGGPRSRALYTVEDGQAPPGPLHSLRIVMTAEDTEALYRETNLMSNHRLGCTVVHDEREAVYDAAVRMRGSERGRPTPSRMSFNVAFPADRLFRGVHYSVSIDRSGGWAFGRNFGQDEILIKHMVQHAGGIPGMYDDLVRVVAPQRAQTGPALLLMARFGRVFLDSQWPGGSEGTAFNFELIYAPTTTVDGRPESLKRPQPDTVTGTDLRDLGDDKESYRWNFLIENRRDRDDYAPLVRLCKAFSVSILDLEASVKEVIDLGQWARAYAMVTLCGVGDTYTFGNNHNAIFWERPADGNVLFFPWDMDFAFTRSATSELVGDENLGRLMRRPEAARLFFAHLRDITESTYRREYMERWIAHYGGLAGQDYSSVAGYIATRRAFVLRSLPREVELAVTTNGGEDFATAEEAVEIEGTAWIDALAVLVSAGAESRVVEWVATTRWRLEVPLARGANRVTVLGFDSRGDLVATDAITVTRTSGERFIRGDADLSGRVEITDAVRILLHLVRGTGLSCADAADADGDGALSLADALRVLRFLLAAGEAPPAPFPLAGNAPAAGSLGCERGLEG